MAGAQRPKLSAAEVETVMVPRLVHVIYPVLYPVEQQDCAIQAKHHESVTELATLVWRAFVKLEIREQK